jgi:cytosine deaminase
MIDLHCDESDDPLSRHIETLAFEATRLGLGARATGSHLTSMHSMDSYYVSKLLPLIAESGINAIANPLINITLQGRHDAYPRRRGLTRIAELRAHGVDVALGQDCVMDPWYGLGGADMLDVAHMAVHAVPMTSREAIAWSFSAVTEIPARVIGLEGYGIDVGKFADMVILQAADPIEAVRLRATRLAVIRRGRVIARTPPKICELAIPGRSGTIDPAAYAPGA